MKFLEFDKSKCDECFKCLRACPTNALSFVGEKRDIIDELCIKCGLCQAHCTPGALKIHNDVPLVKKHIKLGRKVIASIAPSYVGVFNLQEPTQIVSALKKLGFSKVEETAVGAELISKLYEKEISKASNTNIITSCCPSANYLIERYYPELIDNIIPVVSPMVAHGKHIKSVESDNPFVVFIGPCLAKKAEAEEMKDSIDAVITFSELDQWLREEGINATNLEVADFDYFSTARGQAYPLGSSLFKEDLESRFNKKFRYMKIEGIEHCRDFLQSASTNALNNYCVEINICSGSCLNGPDLPSACPSFYERELKLFEHVNNRKTNTNISGKHVSNTSTTLPIAEPNTPLDLSRTFKDKSIKLGEVPKDKLNEILLSMGKYTERDQLNCNACGYNTCVEKATAVYHGFSDIHLCMPSLKAKAESMQSVIFENSPNAICILDEELNILEVNSAFNRILNERNLKLQSLPIFTLMDDDLFQKVKLSNENIIGQKIYIDSIKRTFYINIVNVKTENIVVAILTDITSVEKSRDELNTVKEKTLSTCQEVIEKQMRVAQEIASLLGETTAETKINLNKLKSIVLDN